MRQIDAQEIRRAVAELCIEANCVLPADVAQALERARSSERSDVGCAILDDLLENQAIARSRRLPICQDTGMAVVFAELGQEAQIVGGSFEDAIHAGVAEGYTEGFLRASVVADPLRRGNTGDNTPAVIHLRLVAGDRLKLTLAPKGFGSENMTGLVMLNPTATADAVVDTVVERIRTAGANPCPPVVVGVGLGGTAELALENSKRALLRSIGSAHADPYYAALEARLLAAVNATGVGPGGLGGDNTALAAHIVAAPTHIAGLPCAISLGCHALRHAEKTL